MLNKIFSQLLLKYREVKSAMSFSEYIQLTEDQKMAIFEIESAIAKAEKLLLSDK